MARTEQVLNFMTCRMMTRFACFSSFLEVYQAAMDLYGLIHARFILSPRGLAMMREKFLLGAFGMCQRILCDR